MVCKKWKKKTIKTLICKHLTFVGGDSIKQINANTVFEMMRVTQEYLKKKFTLMIVITIQKVTTIKIKPKTIDIKIKKRQV